MEKLLLDTESVSTLAALGEKTFPLWLHTHAGLAFDVSVCSEFVYSPGTDVFSASAVDVFRQCSGW